MGISNQTVNCSFLVIAQIYQTVYKLWWQGFNLAWLVLKCMLNKERGKSLQWVECSTPHALSPDALSLHALSTDGLSESVIYSKKLWRKSGLLDLWC